MARSSLGFEVIDGQHTAIAAASHPDIAEIPVMIVEAALQADRAHAFIGHNKDRLGMTPMQLHFAAVAAGDAQALAIQGVAEAAGVKILRTTPGSGAYKAAETVSIAAIGSLINRRGAEKATAILQLLARPQLAPIGLAHLKAADMLLHDPEYAGQVEPEAIGRTLAVMGEEADQEARVFAAAHTVPLWRALGVVLFKNRRRRT